MRTTIIVLGLLLSVTAASATYLVLGEYAHESNDLYLVETNLGMIGSSYVPGSAEWPQGSGDSYLYCGGLWAGALTDGPHVSTGVYRFELRPELNNPIDTIYESYEGMPGGLRGIDDDSDGSIDEERRNGRDDDGDGRIDEDFAAISPEMLSCQYNDYQPEISQQYPDHVPLNIGVYQESYGWPQPEGDFYIYHFTVTNEGFQILNGVYLGLFMDPDVGAYSGDDYTGYQVYYLEHRRMPLADASDAYDQVPGYLGTLLLGCGQGAWPDSPRRPNWHAFSHFVARATFPDGDPENDAQRYQALAESCGRFYGPDDVRYVASVGPFAELRPGESVWLDVAIVAGNHYTGMLTAAIRAWDLYVNDLVAPELHAVKRPIAHSRPAPSSRPYAANAEVMLEMLANWPGKQIRLPQSGASADVIAGTSLGLRLRPIAESEQDVAIAYILSESSPISLTVLDAAGRRVQEIASGVWQDAGAHEIAWRSNSALPTGVYFLRLEAGNRSAAARTLIVR